MDDRLWQLLNSDAISKEPEISSCGVPTDEMSPLCLVDYFLFMNTEDPSEQIPTVKVPDDELCDSAGTLLEFAPFRQEMAIDTVEVPPSEFVKESLVVEEWFPKRKTKIQPPDISAGLGKRQDRRDVVELARFAAQQHKLSVYNGCIYRYESPCWKLLNERDAEILLRETFSKFELDDVLTHKEYRDIYLLLRDSPKLQRETEFCQPAHHLNLLDGTLDLETMKLYSHSSSDEFLTYLDLSYQEIQNAEYGSVFESFVDNAGGGDRKVRQQLLELLALAITGYEAKVFYVMLGPSNTGKTQFGRFLEELVGRNNVECIAGVHDFANRFTTSQLEGKRVAMCLDLPDAPLPNVAIGTIKQLVGDDPIKVEAKYKDGRTIYRKPLLLFAGNHPIRIPKAKNEEAFKNRMVVIPFKNPVPSRHQKQQLYKQLMDEAPYIVGQAIEAYSDLLRRNFNVTHTEIPAEYKLQDARPSFEAVERFIAERGVIGEDEGISTNDLYQAYIPYAADMDFPPISRPEFSRLFSRAIAACSDKEVKRVKRINGTEQRGYQGIGLR